MINPQTLNISELPYLPLNQKSKLPDVAGIYLAIDERGKVYYIGQSKNINQRWLQHHRIYQLEHIGNIKIAWLAISETSLLDEVETALIEYFNPPLNNSVVVTKKQRVVFYIDKSTKELLGRLAEEDNRSLSNWLENLVLKEIQGREKEEDVSNRL